MRWQARALHVRLLVLPATWAFIIAPTFAQPVERFDIAGRASAVASHPLVQNSEEFSLQAQLTAVPAAQIVQRGASFELTAALTATLPVCYDDTIFRDDFDGDGF